LRLAGNNNVFLDKNIRAGEDWERLIQERVQAAQYFVCLVTPNSLESLYIRKEIEWAAAIPEITRIAICHNGMTMTACPPELQTGQGYTIPEEGADHYENAVNFVLNGLGYPTY